MTQSGNNPLATEWHLWRQALAGLAGNPLVEYFALAEKRRKRRRVTLYDRLAVILLAVVLIAVAGWMIAEVLRAHLSTEELVSAIITGLLGLASVVYLLVLLNAIYTTVIGSFGVLGTSLEKRRARQLQLDDMLAITGLSDHELALGFLRIIAPRLWWLSLAGAVLIWLWWAAIATEFLSNIEVRQVTILLLTAPLSIGGITISGMLGTVILLSWILVLGTGSASRYYGPVAAAMTCLGQLQHVIVALVTIVGLGMAAGWSDVDSVEYYFGGLLVTALLVLFFYRSFMDSAIRQPGRYAWLVVMVPLLLPLTMATMVFVLDLFNNETGMFAILTLDLVWGSGSVLNPLGMPSVICTGLVPELVDDTHSYGMSGYTFVLELSYLIILLQQLAMVAAGLDALRRAIRKRRQSLA